MIKTDQQINKYVVSLIRNKYTIEEEQYLSRILHATTLGTYILSQAEQIEVAQYQTYVESCRDIGKQMKSDAVIARDKLVYEKALARLSKYKLEDGWPPSTVTDEEGHEYNISEIKPIEPLMVDSKVYDPDTFEYIETVQVLNPIIEKDRKEREAAQAIVDTYRAKYEIAQ